MQFLLSGQAVGPSSELLSFLPEKQWIMKYFLFGDKHVFHFSSGDLGRCLSYLFLFSNIRVNADRTEQLMSYKQ